MNHMQYLFSTSTPTSSSTSSSSTSSSSSSSSSSDPETSTTTEVDPSTSGDDIEGIKIGGLKPSAEESNSDSDSNGELKYVITPEVIISLKKEFVDKTPRSLLGKKRTAEECEKAGEEIFPMMPTSMGISNTYVSRMRTPSDPLITEFPKAANGFPRVVVRGVHGEDEEEEGEGEVGGEKEGVACPIGRHLPLASSALSTAMKIRCADLSLNLIQQHSSLRNRAGAKSFSQLTAIPSNPDDLTVAVPGSCADASPAPSLTGTGTAAAPIPAALSLSHPLDVSLSQAVCQLLVHLTRDKLVRDHLEGVGGVHRLITSIPPFDGKNCIQSPYSLHIILLLCCSVLLFLVPVAATLFHYSLFPFFCNLLWCNCIYSLSGSKECSSLSFLTHNLNTPSPSSSLTVMIRYADIAGHSPSARTRGSCTSHAIYGEYCEAVLGAAE